MTVGNTAFISYSHKDIDAVRKLHKKLERTRIPFYARNQDCKTAYPIFRDETDLSGVTLTPGIEEALADSRYLIVVCTPNSANSEWVGKEITFFLNRFGAERIIPLFLESKFNNQYPGYLEPLKACKSNALCMPLLEKPRLTAPSSLWDWLLFPLEAAVFLYRCITAPTKYRSQRRALFRRLAVMVTDGDTGVDFDPNTLTGVFRFFFLLAVIVCVPGWLFDSFSHTCYYRDMVFSLNKPCGVEELQLWDTWFSDDYYKCTVQNGLILRTEHIAPEDPNPLPGRYLLDADIMEFAYADTTTGDEIVSRVVMRDRSGEVRYVKNFGLPAQCVLEGVDAIVPVDLTVSADSADPYFLPAYVDRIWQETESGNASCRLDHYYDIKGQLVTVLFLNDSSLKYYVSDESDRYWGVAFTYDSQGELSGAAFLEEADLEAFLGTELEPPEEEN